MTQRFDRFKDAEWFGDKTVLIGGCGGIGSWLSLFLSRAGFTEVIYDDDKVEEHNIGGQLYGIKNVGKTKVDAIAEIIYQFTGDNRVHVFCSKMNKTSPTNNYVFAAFDNMKARKELFENWLESYEHDSDAIFIDGRLTAESFQIFIAKGNNATSIQEYKNSLFDDSEVEDEPCTLKQTTHMAAMIASYMTGFFTNFIVNVKEKDEVRQVPNLHSFYLPNLYYE
jgi:molybdopterin/thiamine biosynthesis adenylyltransferase